MLATVGDISVIFQTKASTDEENKEPKVATVGEKKTTVAVTKIEKDNLMDMNDEEEGMLSKAKMPAVKMSMAKKSALISCKLVVDNNSNGDDDEAKHDKWEGVDEKEMKEEEYNKDEEDEANYLL